MATMGTVGYVWVLRNEHTLEIVGVYNTHEAALEADAVIGKRECNIMMFNLIGVQYSGDA